MVCVRNPIEWRFIWLEKGCVHTLICLAKCLRYPLWVKHRYDSWPKQPRTKGTLLMSPEENQPVNKSVCLRKKTLLCPLSPLASCCAHFLCWPALSPLSLLAGLLVVTYYPLLGTAGSDSPLFLFQALSRGFSKNMKLEAVNPRNPGEVCVATVVNVKGRMLWLHLEGVYNQLLSGLGGPHQRVG